MKEPGKRYSLPQMMAMDAATALQAAGDWKVVQRLEVLRDLGGLLSDPGRATPGLSGGGSTRRLKLASLHREQDISERWQSGLKYQDKNCNIYQHHGGSAIEIGSCFEPPTTPLGYDELSVAQELSERTGYSVRLCYRKRTCHCQCGICHRVK